MEGMEGSQEKGEEYDEALPSSNEKKRKSPAAAEREPSTSQKVHKRNDGDAVEGPRKSKKRREGAEALHAESQRLLRETTGISFVPEQPTKVLVSSLIEKIRRRKLQLAQSSLKTSTSSLGGSSNVLIPGLKEVPSEGKAAVDGTEQNDEIEFVRHKPSTLPTLKQVPGHPKTSGIARDESIENILPVDNLDEMGDGGSGRPKTPDTLCGRSTSNSLCKSPPTSFLRAPVLESQDLYSDSQLSFRDESPVAGDEDDALPAADIRMNLHLDSETQDDDLSSWLLEDDEKENRDPTVRAAPVRPAPELFPTVSHVRGLVDDEAEDEDDDPLEEEEDEDEDTAGELQDLLTQDAGEKAADIERRSELHSRWLEQQDLDMEDNILHRIESGWKSKGKKEIPTLLREMPCTADDLRKPSGRNRVVESVSAGCLSSFEDLKDQVKDIGRIKRATTGPIDQSDLQESSDDEETEEKLRRQLFLEESEEQTEFLSVTDDESSREIFSLINKVNVTTIKPRTAHSDSRTNGTGHHHAPSLQNQSSFLRRKVTTSVATTKQGSGNSRSYVFARDDSNSRDISRSDDKKVQETGKAKSLASSSNEQGSGLNSTQFTQKSASSGSKGNLSKDMKPRGPSLFQVLKQQAADLASGNTSLDWSGSNSRGDDLSIFLAIKPSRQVRSSRGT